ncbi:hypothetical protein FVE85_3022 [Porphyridium purpureum]|uniref:Uncharacterized protein n=1 Tax=Porphyridium purpureum TaxID=35688 RepID=A0A5J4YTE5_PORPP|nr:hypothetical protein FVE85_3022 [Porphyridium purpureum]|eukprot:POR5815..scf227_4
MRKRTYIEGVTNCGPLSSIGSGASASPPFVFVVAVAAVVASTLFGFVSSQHVQRQQIVSVGSGAGPGSGGVLLGQRLCVDTSLEDGEFVVVASATRMNAWQGGAFMIQRNARTGLFELKGQGQGIRSEFAEGAQEHVRGVLRAPQSGDSLGFDCVLRLNKHTLLLSAPGTRQNRGLVRVFHRNMDSEMEDEDAAWVENTRATLESPNAFVNERYGSALAASLDGETLLVAAKGHMLNLGAVYVYHCSAGGSTRKAVLFEHCDYLQMLLPEEPYVELRHGNARVRNNFGVALAVSEDGLVLVVGAPGEKSEQGSAHVYVRQSQRDEFIFMQTLSQPNPQEDSFFGYRLAMSGDASVIAVGADGERQYAGAAYVFMRNFDSGMYSLLQELRLEAGLEEDNFGGSLALNRAGTTLIVGAPGAKSGRGEPDVGALFVYRRSWSNACAADGVSSGISQMFVLDQHITPILRGEASLQGSFFAWDVAMDPSARFWAASVPYASERDGYITFGTFEARTDNLCAQSTEKEEL